MDPMQCVISIRNVVFIVIMSITLLFITLTLAISEVYKHKREVRESQIRPQNDRLRRKVYFLEMNLRDARAKIARNNRMSRG